MGAADATQLVHLLPELPYPAAALEPHIDARTMTLHHGKHHASYVANLNAALAKLPTLATQTALWMLRHPDELPEDTRATILNNAGGHVNHSLLWRSMSPNGGGEPGGALADAIKRDFGGLEQLKVKFADAGAAQFGSGWVWLTKGDRDGGQLHVSTTAGHDNPAARGLHPILVNDVWEHAYYLKYENRRGDYLKSWWSVVNWTEAARRFEGVA